MKLYQLRGDSSNLMLTKATVCLGILGATVEHRKFWLWWKCLDDPLPTTLFGANEVTFLLAL